MVDPIVVRTQNLTRRLQGEIPVTLVQDVSLQIERGDFAIITGPSGSGKSSLLYLLGLLDMPTNGSVWLNGTNTGQCSETELADLRLSQIGFVFQFHFLLPEFTALQNVMLPMERLGKLSREEAEVRGSELLTSLGLGQHLHKRPKQLSGGQSQRVAIARALANNPLLVLSDEPTGNLDSAATANVRDILRKLAFEHNRAIVTVTHDPSFAQAGDRIIRIVDGCIESDAVQ